MCDASLTVRDKKNSISNRFSSQPKRGNLFLIRRNPKMTEAKVSSANRPSGVFTNRETGGLGSPLI